MQSFDRIFFALVILLYTSCAEEKPAQQSPADSDSVLSSSPEPEILSAPDSVSLSTADTSMKLLQEWQKELQDTGINMALKNFYRAGRNEFELYDQGEWDGSLMSNYVSSPDNRYYSFEYSSWGDGDADTYVHIIDRIKKRQYIVEVLGTCCSYEGTGWLNDHTLVAIGYDVYEAEEKHPGEKLTQGMYTVYDLSTGQSTYYKSKNYFRRPCDCGPTTSK